MNPFQDAFGSFYRVEGKSSANKRTELLITQRVEAPPGFGHCAPRVDYQRQADAVALPCCFIITSRLADSTRGRLEAKLAPKRHPLTAPAFFNRIQSAWRNSLPKFLSHLGKRRHPNLLINSAEHHDRQPDETTFYTNLPQAVTRDRQNQSDILPTRVNDLNLQAEVDLPFSINVL